MEISELLSQIWDKMFFVLFLILNIWMKCIGNKLIIVVQILEIEVLDIYAQY